MLEENYANKTMYSSKNLGSGVNMISEKHSEVKFTDIALQNNKGYKPDDIKMGIISLGKEWRYYKKELDKDRRA
jgi:ribosome biogenesis GTPase A